MSERQYAAHAGISRGAVQKARSTGRLVLRDDGTIDASPRTMRRRTKEAKRLPFAQAAVGMIGLETLLCISLDLVHNKHLSLLDMLRKMTVAPASILGLPYGKPAKGAPADLVLFDPERAWKIAEKDFRSKSKNSPFDDRPVQGRAMRTWIAGRTAFALVT